MAPDLYLLPAGTFDDETVWKWYRNINLEFDDSFLETSAQKNRSEHYLKAGNPDYKKAYFRRHFSRSFAAAARFLLKGRHAPHIIDLGCGIGSQSLFLALQGAKVTAIDLDGEALKVLARRKALYEQVSGRSLDIELLEADSFTLDYASMAPISGLYSMFAFNMMQPSARLMDLMMQGFAADARLAVIDGNNQSWLPRILPARRRNVWSPTQFADELSKRGFIISGHAGAVSLPPPTWRAGTVLLSPLDDWLNKGWLFPISHQILAERHAEAGG